MAAARIAGPADSTGFPPPRVSDVHSDADKIRAKQAAAEAKKKAAEGPQPAPKAGGVVVKQKFDL